MPWPRTTPASAAVPFWAGMRGALAMWPLVLLAIGLVGGLVAPRVSPAISPEEAETERACPASTHAALAADTALLVMRAHLTAPAEPRILDAASQWAATDFPSRATPRSSPATLVATEPDGRKHLVMIDTGEPHVVDPRLAPSSAEPGDVPQRPPRLRV